MLEPARTVIAQPSEDYPLYVTAKCYRPQWPGCEDGTGMTFVFLHGVGSHKETFEPTIANLFNICAAQADAQSSYMRIREVWSIDCPTHGQSGILNEAILRKPEWDGKFSAKEYAKAAYTILTKTGPDGMNINFHTQSVLGLGHSMGGISMAQLASNLPFAAVFIVDPPWIVLSKHAGLPRLAQVQQKLLGQAYERKDTWPTLEAAHKHMLTRAPKWTPECHEVFVKYALRPHPAPTYGIPYHGVMTCCTREQEAPLYDAVEEAVDKSLDVLCKRISVHFVFGDVPNVIPKIVQKSIIQSRMNDIASVTWLEDVGHFVPQESPRKLAEVIFEKSSQINRGPGPRL